MNNAMDVVRLSAVAAVLGLGSAIAASPTAWADGDTAGADKSSVQSESKVRTEPSKTSPSDADTPAHDEKAPEDDEPEDEVTEEDEPEEDGPADESDSDDTDSQLGPDDRSSVERASEKRAYRSGRTDSDDADLASAGTAAADPDSADVDAVVAVKNPGKDRAQHATTVANPAHPTPTAGTADRTPPQVRIESTDEPPHPLSEFRPVRALVLGTLGLFGFDSTPEPGSPNNPVLETIWGLYRRIESFVANERPRFYAPVSVETEYIEDGELFTFRWPPPYQQQVLDDYDDDPLTVTIDDDGEHGNLIAHSDGTFSYQVDADFRGTDTVTITAHDNGFHLQNILTPGSHKTTATFVISIYDDQEPTIAVAGSTNTRI